MRKILFIILGIVLTFSACSKDDDEDSLTDEEYSKLIIGTWQYVSPIDCKKCDPNDYMIFHENGKLIEHSECEKQHCNCQECHNLFGEFEYDEDSQETWKIENGYLTIGGLKESVDDWFPDEFTYKIIKIDETTLKYEILGVTGTFKRVPDILADKDN